MMAYSAPNGAFLLADQFGNAHTWRTGAQGIEIIAGRGSTLPAGTVIGQVARFYSQGGPGAAYILRETVLMQTVANAPLGQRIGIALLIDVGTEESSVAWRRHVAGVPRSTETRSAPPQPRKLATVCAARCTA